MEQEQKEKILARLKAMFEIVARDPESEEAKTAAKLAGQIMAKYGISEENLKVTSDEGQPNIVGEEIDMSQGANFDWEKLLGATIEYAFDVRVVRVVRVVYVMNKPTKLNKMTLVGFKQDMELATWYYKYLRLVISRKTSAYSRSESSMYSFASGMISSIYSRFEEIKKYAQEARDVKTTDLVLYKAELVGRVVQQLFPNLVNDKIKDEIDRSAFAKGYVEGKKVGLGRPIAPSDSKDGGSSGSSGPIAIE